MYLKDYGPYVSTYPDGSKFYYLHGQCHREAGPAAEYANGTKYYFLHGQCHRIDGPAIERADGRKSWYLDGKELSEAEFNKKITPE